ncbi:MAG: hypothetical protein AAB914_00110 [Patescibacteria group bacterium]
MSSPYDRGRRCDRPAPIRRPIPPSVQRAVEAMCNDFVSAAVALNTDPKKTLPFLPSGLLERDRDDSSHIVLPQGYVNYALYACGLPVVE